MDFVAQTPQGLEQIKCHRSLPVLSQSATQVSGKFWRALPKQRLNLWPQLSEQYESNVRGLYIVGALAGYPLIKQA